MFDATADIKGPGGAAVELHCPFDVCVEGFNHALQLWWAADIWKDLEETASADKIKRFCEVNESDIQEHMLFSALLLELTFQLGSRTVILDRRSLPASAVGSR